MKNMEIAYMRKAGTLLGLSAEDAVCPSNLPGDRKGYLFDADGSLSLRFHNAECEKTRLSEERLPAELEPLRGNCLKTRKLDNALWLELREPLPALSVLEDSGTVSGDLIERLRSFMTLRACISPELHPGLGLLLDRADSSVFPAALLLDKCGEAEDGLIFPWAMNLELTTQCPLRCPQCYVHLEAGRHMPKEVAFRRLDQAAALGVWSVNLSGGETMCYPWLIDVIKRCVQNGMEPDVALSGYGITDESLQDLIDAGVNGIYVSLNGPTEEINSQTRDGYALAIALLRKLRDRGFPNTYINWVVHNSNADVLPDMLRLAEEYGVRGIMIIAFKPDSRNALPTLPSAEQMGRLAKQIRGYQGPLDLNIESCYSPLRALAGKSLFGNRNRIALKGCGAGRDTLSVALDGSLTPCRHIPLNEDWDDIADYWEKSPVLKQIREVQRHPEEPCRSCEFSDACRHCSAINLKLHGKLSRGDSSCPLAKKEA